MEQFTTVKTVKEEVIGLLDTAKQIVGKDRRDQYGKPENTFAMIAKLWSTYLRVNVSARQVAVMMILLKAARDAHAPKRDNLIDIAGYAACADELGGNHVSRS